MADDIRHVQRALRQAQDRRRKRAQRTDEYTGVPKQCFDTALCIGLLADYDMQAGAAWIEPPQRRGLACKYDTRT